MTSDWTVSCELFQKGSLSKHDYQTKTTNKNTTSILFFKKYSHSELYRVRIKSGPPLGFSEATQNINNKKLDFFLILEELLGECTKDRRSLDTIPTWIVLHSYSTSSSCECPTHWTASSSLRHSVDPSPTYNIYRVAHSHTN